MTTSSLKRKDQAFFGMVYASMGIIHQISFDRRRCFSISG